MKIRILIAAILLSPLILLARDPEKVELWRLEQFETGEWVSLRFGFYRSHGDYTTQGPQIILQKLPDNRVLVSRVDDGRFDPPVAIRFLTQKEAEKVRKTVATFHRAALSEVSLQEWVDTHKGEERLELMKKHFPHGYVYTTMELRVTKPDGTTVGASTNFDEKKKTLSKFDDYFKRLLVPLKRVKRPAADDPEAKAKELSIQEMEKENQDLRMELQRTKKELSQLQRMLKEL